MTEEIPHEKRWLLIILIGCLSMFMAEVFAGSSQMWFIDAWSLIVTYWLYLGHLLLFLNLAIRTKRTSVPQLYLWGVLFALYESWITKVLWFGYPGSEGPAITLIGGIAILEFSTLVFFWHPILAFVMPVLVFESFALSQNSQLKHDQRIFISHFEYLKKTNKKFMFFCLFLVLIGSAFLSLNTGFNMIVALIAVFGSIGLIYLFFTLSGRYNPNSFSIYSLKLGKTGLCIVIIYLLLLYVVTFFFLLPERIPTSIIPFLIIIGFYLFIGLMLRVSRPRDENIVINYEGENFYSANFFFKIYAIMVILISIFCLVPIIGIIFGFIMFLGIFFIAPLFFLVLLKRALKNKKL